MSDSLVEKRFEDIDFNESFFDSLKEDYPGFKQWFKKKQDEGEKALVLYNEENKLDGLLYLKDDGKRVDDVVPVLEADHILKIGTFKINPHQTRLGERFIKVALDYAVQKCYSICYVTIFTKHEKLIELFENYGFELEGYKYSGEEVENVYVKKIDAGHNDICKDYPLVKTRGVKKYILAIYPKYHSVMFPDSKLKTETGLYLEDVSHTNSIHKNYICSMDVSQLQRGDIIVLYRTSSRRPAEYSSVVTSVCVVEEIKHQSDYENFEEFYIDASKYSPFDREDLLYWYRQGNCKVIRMLYSFALPKRITRHDLIENVGLNRDVYWGFFELSDDQFKLILEKSEVNMRYIVQEGPNYV